MIKIMYALCPSSPAEDMLSKLRELLPAEVTAEADKYIPIQKKFTFVLGRLILAELLQNNLTGLQKTSLGKPFLPGHAFFSISYSHDLVVCAMSEIQHIGLDVEFINHQIEVDDFGLVLNQQDQRYISNSRHKVEAFYKIWTAKESVMKADGRGFQIDMKKILLSENNATIAGEDSSDWQLKWFEPLPSYQMALSYRVEQEIVFQSYDALYKIEQRH